MIRRPVAGRTLVSTSSSGLEVRLGLWTRPVWEYELTFEFVRNRQPYNYIGQMPVPSTAVGDYGTTADDEAGLAGFFMAAQGSLTPWYFDDPNDDAIIQAQIGVGDGSTTAFQGVRTLGAYSEPIQNINGTPVAPWMWATSTPIALGTIAIPSLVNMRVNKRRFVLGYQQVGWPLSWTCTTAGTTGTVEPNWRSASQPTLTLNDGSVVWTFNGVGTALYVEKPTPAWSTGVKTLGVSIVPTSGNAGGYLFLCTVAGSAGGSAPSWPQTVGATVVDGSVTWTNFGVPQVGVLNNIVPLLTSMWSQTLGVFTLGTAPLLNQQIFLTSGFYQLCRFQEDKIELDEFIDRFHKVGKLSFISIKQ